MNEPSVLPTPTATAPLNLSRIQAIADDWKAPERNAQYYHVAEHWIEQFWGKKEIFRRYFETLNKRRLVELACGHGRHTQFILNEPTYTEIESLRLLDVNEQNVAICRERFAAEPRVSVFTNNGCDLQPLEDGSATALFCYDAMVHFEYDCVFAYIREAHRILAGGGRALFHHSNYDHAPGAVYSKNPHWRNFMTKNLFAHVAQLSGFIVVSQRVIPWGKDENYVPDLDCVTLLEKRYR
ncbi:MAG: hypothetical protein B9S32_05335 [Verrucomicrobia bacterium Tous-C9LFEB]|nr:MAG: hypothetical protein B9S32_05335 [Verrucomicrobia bacterium Tous-C9LFEB]